MAKILFIIFLIFFLPLQALAYGVNPQKYFNSGIIYSGSKFPQSVANNTENVMPQIDISHLKKGTASSRNFFKLIEVGDASIDKATKNAGITKISYIDVNEKSIFIFWRRVTINVYGNNLITQ